MPATVTALGWAPLPGLVAKSPREVVKTAVGIAAVVPAIGLLVLAVSLALSGGFGGVLAGILVGLIAVALLAAAFLWTYAPVSIRRFLEDTEAKRQGTDGQAPGSDGGEEDGHGPGPSP